MFSVDVKIMKVDYRIQKMKARDQSRDRPLNFNLIRSLERERRFLERSKNGE